MSITTQLKEIMHRHKFRRQTDLEYAIKTKKVLRNIKFGVVAGAAFIIFIIAVARKDVPVQLATHSHSVNYTGYYKPLPTAAQAAIIAKEFVRNTLKSPSSAEFPFGDYRVSNTTDTFFVAGHVDAQNSFGAMLRGQYICVLKYNSGDWSNVNNWTLISADMVN